MIIINNEEKFVDFINKCLNSYNKVWKTNITLSNIKIDKVFLSLYLFDPSGRWPHEQNISFPVYSDTIDDLFKDGQHMRDHWTTVNRDLDNLTTEQYTELGKFILKKIHDRRYWKK